MRWLKDKPRAKHGDQRNKRRFAFLPVQIAEYQVWLETYESVQEYRKVSKFNGRRGWYELDWVEIDRKMLDYYP
jgi:hypothetical protein